ncbi:LuxR C-terminal-related transcriptional regulator [Chloroflexota bacterium]
MKARVPTLTREQRDILILAAPHLHGQHLSNNDIAQRIGIPATRVKTLIHQACVKLGAHNRIEAVFFALLKRDIRLNDVYSLDELAEIFRMMCPDMFRKITRLVSQEIDYGHLPWRDEQVVNTGREDGKNVIMLTSTERDVLIFAGRGLTNKQIADKLYISNSSVRTFLYRAGVKLGAHNRINTFLLAIKRGEINLSDIFSVNELLPPITQLGTEFLENIAQLISKEPGQEPVDLPPTAIPLFKS